MPRRARRFRPADRAEPGRAVSDRRGLHRGRGRQSDAFRGLSPLRRGSPCGAQANMAKYLAAKSSWEAANACLQFHGGFGFACEYDVERKFRETRLYQVAPISTNLILSLSSPSTCSGCRGRSDDNGCAAAVIRSARPCAGAGGRGAVLLGAACRRGRASLKIERPEGDFARGYDDVALGQSSYFVWLNRGKESVVCDLASAEGKRTIRDLVTKSDMVVQNLKPGALGRLGLGSAEMRRLESRRHHLLDQRVRRDRADGEP